LNLPELLEHIAERSGYGLELRATGETEGQDRWANVQELRRMAGDYAEIETPIALEIFLENVALVGGADTTQTSEDGTLAEENADAVTLITLHAAKGLEYPIVFILGMDEGSLPHSRSQGRPEELEEERRLTYVGFTRAMQRLYLVRAQRRSIFGDAQSTQPSRFLSDIPPALLHRKGSASTGSTTQKTPRSTRRRQTHWDDDNQDPYGEQDTGHVFGRGIPNTPQRDSNPNPPHWSTPPKAPGPSRPGSSFTSTPKGPSSSSTFSGPLNRKKKIKGQQFNPGDRVRHDRFGAGIILKSEMEGETEFVEVQFEGNLGKKRLSMDFANLEKL
jgi:DNA helicase-2/ATP-dependent DNA helicase PcrA